MDLKDEFGISDKSLSLEEQYPDDTISLSEKLPKNVYLIRGVNRISYINFILLLVLLILSFDPKLVGIILSLIKGI